jgi:predicted phosphate transport protein (TIGR00153 family)
MKLDALIQWFLPREERFHELLERASTNLLAVTELFVVVADSARLEDRRVKLVEMKALEHEGDRITRQIFEALNSTFITPFDREDIRQLAVDLDDIIDYVEGISQFLVVFEIETAPESLRRFARILHDLAREIDRISKDLWDRRNEARLQAGIVKISELENLADELYLGTLGDLFRDRTRDARETLKWKEIFQGLEDACDKCKDFTHVVGNILIKNA